MNRISSSLTRPNVRLPQHMVTLLELGFIIPSEMVDEEHCNQLAAVFAKAGYWTNPIAVDRESGLIMDGNHRYQAAHKLGLKRIPCVRFDYDNPDVQVFHWKSGEIFEKEKLIQLFRENGLFPVKTTRHKFGQALPRIRVPLSALR